jgi:hypothetical protein
MPDMALHRVFLVAAAIAGVLSAGASIAQADALLYRCGPNVCRVAPDGSSQRALTSDGQSGGPVYGWLSASADGTRLAVVRATFAYVLDGSGRTLAGPLPRGGTAVIAEIAPDGSQVATVELLPEITPAPVSSPPGSPGLSGFVPYLFVMAPDGAGREAAARAVVDAGWLGGRLVRTDSSSTAPFPLGLCLLAANTSFECARDVARDPTRDLFNPAFSPDGRFAAVVGAPEATIGAGPIVIYDTATATPVRTLTSGPDTQPTWSPDGQSIAFARNGDLYVTGAQDAPGRERRVLTGGQQPVWVSAPACSVRSHPPVRVTGRSVIVSACAPQPGSVTVTLRRGNRRVARHSVRAATGGIVTVRLRGPAGARAKDLRAQARFAPA